MKRLIIPFVAAFAVSLGAATGVVMMRAPAPVPPAAPGTAAADSSQGAKDSTRNATAPETEGVVAQSQDSAAKVDSGTVADVPAGTKAGTPTTEHSVTAAKLEAVTRVPPSIGTKSDAHEPPRKTEIPVVTPVSDTLINHRLAKVFAAMQAKDAARVLEQMNDNDVRAILGSLSSKQQAAILGNFPTARAASIVQITLRTPSNGGTE